MPRKLLIRTDEFPYHIMARSNNKDWFSLPSETVWQLLTKLLEETIDKYKISPHAFVLMKNHFHILLSTPSSNLDQGMHYLIHRMSLEIGKRCNRINHVFGGRYKWCLIDNLHYYNQVYRYIYQNPVRAQVCSKIEDYPFSSFNLKKLYSKTAVEVVKNKSAYTPFHFQDPHGELYWLNDIFDTEIANTISKGLRHRNFEISSRKSKVKNFFEVGKDDLTHAFAKKHLAPFSLCN